MSNYIQLPKEPRKALYYLSPFLIELLHFAALIGKLPEYTSSQGQKRKQCHGSQNK